MTSEFGPSFLGEKLEVVSEQLLSPIAVRFLLPILDQSVSVFPQRLTDLLLTFWQMGGDIWGNLVEKSALSAPTGAIAKA
jgi:hypothetical protein